MDDRSFDISQIKMPAVPAKSISTGVIALLIVGGLLSTFYQIQPEEMGVVLRFGLCPYDRTRITRQIAFN